MSDLNIQLGLRKPETAKETEDASTIDGMRRAILRAQRDSSLIANTLSASHYRGLSGEDTYVMLAYHALRMLEDQWQRNLEWSRLSPNPGPILLGASVGKSDRMLALLRSVQTDAGNWLHAELQAAIEKEIGPAGPYRNLSDSGVAESET